MSQGRFSTHILLIGLVLIGYNTVLMLCNVGYELIVLIGSLIWSVIKIAWLTFCSYPLTLISLYLLSKIKKAAYSQGKKGNFLYNVLM